ncbi:TldD/PmbA family protein [Streptomyces sp. HK10]|uniref:TldD/PmbA family protein n=1 Tax=Streptomyces sp. HK10 TaxID=3373255 RepID=UPI00374A506C
MLDEGDIRRILHAALVSGADWGEVYAERRTTTLLSLSGHEVESVSSSLDAGVGVRVVKDGFAAYAYTNSLDRESLLATARTAGAGVTGDVARRPVALARSTPAFVHRAARPSGEATNDDRVALVRRAADSAWAQGKDIHHVRVSYLDQSQDVLVADSEGRLARDARERTRLICHVVARRDGRAARGFEGPGGATGLDFYDTTPPESIGRAAARQALHGLGAEPMPTGEMTVVLHPGEGGVLLHEACGHGLEGDVMADGTSVYAATPGAVLADAEFTAVDDSTVPAEWSAAGFDDEGTPGQRTVLFDRGRQTGVLTDRLTSGPLGATPTGNGRRQSYAHLPQPRMTSTSVLPGSADPAELVRQVRRGLYAVRLSGGEVDSTTGDFVFGVTEGVLIENGELTQPVRNANLIGNGPRTLGLIEAVGSDFGTKQGMCGKGGQWVPASFGSPTVRVARITVGGRRS